MLKRISCLSRQACTRVVRTGGLGHARLPLRCVEALSPDIAEDRESGLVAVAGALLSIRRRPALLQVALPTPAFTGISACQTRGRDEPMVLIAYQRLPQPIKSCDARSSPRRPLRRSARAKRGKARLGPNTSRPIVVGIGLYQRLIDDAEKPVADDAKGSAHTCSLSPLEDRVRQRRCGRGYALIAARGLEVSAPAADRAPSHVPWSNALIASSCRPKP